MRLRRAYNDGSCRREHACPLSSVLTGAWIMPFVGADRRVRPKSSTGPTTSWQAHPLDPHGAKPRSGVVSLSPRRGRRKIALGFSRGYPAMIIRKPWRGAGKTTSPRNGQRLIGLGENATRLTRSPAAAPLPEPARSPRLRRRADRSRRFTTGPGESRNRRRSTTPPSL